MEYKSTLNLPKTDFAMKANLAQREPERLAAWETMDLHGQVRAKSAGRPKFILHDGPPYANGRIHIGHALNKILKDIIVRYKTLRGFDAPYVPGWDCHGLPVEHQLFKDLKKTKDQVDRVTFRKMAHDYAMKYVVLQRDEFKRLGIGGEWETPYLTLDKSYETGILAAFTTLVKKGYVVRGLKPVNWCSRCETALAEAEVEYADHTSHSVFVAFKVRSDARAASLKLAADASFVIWTTTPWTLLANVAVALHPDLSYVEVATDQGTFIVARDLLSEELEKKLGWTGVRVLATHAGRDLEGLTYDHPFLERAGRVVLADYVSKEDGSGCVHTAPGHGQEDFMTGLKYKLDVIMPVDTKGRFDKTAGAFAGQYVFEANAGILALLKERGRLLHSGEIVHSYPHCWRCKSPVIFRATKQWFLKIDHDGLRGKLLAAIKNDVAWVPSSGEERITSMVAGRPDWCLSRQRYWGVPIPAVVCRDCGEHHLSPDVLDRLSKRVVAEGTDVWFTAPVTDFIPSGFACACGGTVFDRGEDILDVWFDSGVSHQAVLKKRPDLALPADLYLEGSDQHRGWFQASLIPSMAIDNQAPFKAVLTHGFVVDGEGRKMSKSLGNVVSPQEVLKDFGADILRLWVLSSDYNEDVRLSKHILETTADAYRKIRNTARFLLSNLYDFFPSRDSVSRGNVLVIDRWALSRYDAFVREVTDAYESYQFYVAFQRIFAFCNETLSSLYLDILKDRLYTSGAASLERRSAQTALYEILKGLAAVLAPVMPFTADEIHASMRAFAPEIGASVHLEAWPEAAEASSSLAPDLLSMERVLDMRPAIMKALEAERGAGKIGSSLEASVTLKLKDAGLFADFKKFVRDLRYFFIVSKFDVVLDAGCQEAFALEVARAQGVKCVRCWNFSTDVGHNSVHPELCGRCVAALGGRS